MENSKGKKEINRVITRKKRSEQFILNYQARIFVYRLYSYFKKESSWGAPIKPLSNVIERVAHAYEISTKTVSKILSKSESELSKKVAIKKKVYVTPKSIIEPFDECAVRNHIYSYYERKEWPTRKKLVYTLKVDNLFNGNKLSLDTVLDKIKFKWRRVNKKKCLLEKSDVIAARCLFFENIQRYDMKSIIFVGETYISTGPQSKDGRIILLHAGSVQGFVPKCCFFIKTLAKEEINANMIKKWFCNTLLKNIAEPSVIVIDNTPNNLILMEKTLNIFSKKKDIQDWLTKNNIEWSPSMLKGVLLDLVNSHKPSKRKYELDELAQNKGHTVIRLPLKHSEFNPIEMIWNQIKAKVARENKTQLSLNGLKNLIKTAVESITVEDWNRAVDRTVKVIEEARIREAVVEECIEEMLMMGGEEWSSSSESESEYDETDQDEDDDDDEEGEQEMFTF